jgi:hypothetical protein
VELTVRRGWRTGTGLHNSTRRRLPSFRFSIEVAHDIRMKPGESTARRHGDTLVVSSAC